MVKRIRVNGYRRKDGTLVRSHLRKVNTKSLESKFFVTSISKITSEWWNSLSEKERYDVLSNFEPYEKNTDWKSGDLDSKIWYVDFENTAEYDWDELNDCHPEISKKIKNMKYNIIKKKK